MKLLIIAIMLLFSSTVLADSQLDTHQQNLSPSEFDDFVTLNIKRGLASDEGVYMGYLTKTYNYGTATEIMLVAMRYSVCSIMWRDIIELTAESKELNQVMFYAAIWRSIEMAKWYVLKIGGKVDQLESAVIPLIAEKGVIISEALIYGCTALDVAGFQQLAANGHAVLPGKDWVLEPIPKLPELKKPPTSSTLPGTFTYL